MIRAAGPRDVPLLIELMRGLAEYEKLPPPGPSAARRIARALRNREIHAFLSDRAGYALYFFAFSSFLARPTLWLEDLFVLPEARGAGHGRTLFEACVRTARRRGCGRMEWAVLDWNEPAHRFYRKAGAKVLREWNLYRLPLRRDAF